MSDDRIPSVIVVGLYMLLMTRVTTTGGQDSGDSLLWWQRSSTVGDRSGVADDEKKLHPNWCYHPGSVDSSWFVCYFFRRSVDARCLYSHCDTSLVGALRNPLHVIYLAQYEEKFRGLLRRVKSTTTPTATK